jgi:hypothetical protein
MNVKHSASADLILQFVWLVSFRLKAEATWLLVSGGRRPARGDNTSELRAQARLGPNLTCPWPPVIPF